MDERGVLFVGIGEQYVHETVNAVKQLRNHTEVPVAIVTDYPEKVPDSVEYVLGNDSDATGVSLKILNMKQTPFEKTVFLDTDVYVVDKITPLFTLLDRVDMAAATKPDNYRRLEDHRVEGVPETFPEPNTGVIAYRRAAVESGFFDTWSEIDRGGSFPHDQPAFRKAIYDSEFCYHSLRPEWNCRFMVPGQLCRKVTIFHGRPWRSKPLHKQRSIPVWSNEYRQRMEDIVSKLNRTDLPRVHWPTPRGQIRVEVHRDPRQILRSETDEYTFRHRVMRSIHKNGFWYTVRKAVDRGKERL